MVQEICNQVFDKGSFVQTYAYMVSPYGNTAQKNGETAAGDGVVSGYGTIAERLVYCAIQDSSCLRGALGTVHAAKIVRTIDMAVRMGAPFILFIDSAGARLEEGLDVLSGYGEIMKSMSTASGQVPLISVIVGGCPGAAATAASLADFVLMTEQEKSYLCLNGPELIKANTGKTVALKEMAGAVFQGTVSGAACIVRQTEAACFAALKDLIDYLPDNSLSGAPYSECGDDPNRDCAVCREKKTFEAYDVRDVISEICDNHAFFELYEGYAANIVTGFGRFNGRVAGIIANQSAMEDGMLNTAACGKASALIDFCDTYHIPILTLTNTPGFAADEKEEGSGAAAASAMLASSFANSNVPKLNVIIGKAYGNAYIVMNSRHIGADYVYAWPGADIAAMSPEANAVILYQDEIKNSEDPIAKRTELAAVYRKTYASPYYAASKGFVDDIMEPGETRGRIISAFEMMAGKQ